jgi:mono/diheme cytochrome c family protein
MRGSSEAVRGALLGASLVLGVVVSMDSAPIQVMPPTDAAHGERLYVQLCQSCDGDREGKRGTPGVPGHGPDGHTWQHSDCALMTTIARGQNSHFYALAMPAWGDSLSYVDMRDVVAYLKTFWTPAQLALRARWSGPPPARCPV